MLVTYTFHRFNVQALRPRRVSRAPSRMGDENSTGAITTTGGPRLANKASNTALSTVGGVRVGKAAIGVAVAIGKAGSTTSVTAGVGAGPRRALLDTTNAIRVSQGHRSCGLLH